MNLGNEELSAGEHYLRVVPNLLDGSVDRSCATGARRTGGEYDSGRSSKCFDEGRSSAVAHAEVIERQRCRIDAKRAKEDATASWRGGDLHPLRPATAVAGAYVAELD
jgi:hypothetical protein